MGRENIQASQSHVEVKLEPFSFGKYGLMFWPTKESDAK